MLVTLELAVGNQKAVSLSNSPRPRLFVLVSRSRRQASTYGFATLLIVFRICETIW